MEVYSRRKVSGLLDLIRSEAKASVSRKSDVYSVCHVSMYSEITCLISFYFNHVNTLASSCLLT